MNQLLLETYTDLAQKNVSFFAGRYGFSNGADACVVKVGNQAGLFLDIDRIRTEPQETVAVIHEWAHLESNAVYGFNTSPASIMKAEAVAHRLEIKKLLPYDDLKGAIQKELLTNSYEIAEYFQVPVDLVLDAIKYYTGPCGLTL